MIQFARIVFTTIAGIFSIAALILTTGPVQSSPKSDAVGKPIPADVMKIVDKSCVHCHMEPGDPMALTHLNLSNWDKYPAKKQAGKAQSMCGMVSKDKMPPKAFRVNHPDGVLTDEDIKTMNAWAQSLQAPAK